MPRYTFTGDHETVLLGLSHGVNAKLHRPKHGQPDGSTVVALPGDEVTTDETYDHAHMDLLDGRRTAKAATRPAKRTAKKAAPKKPPAEKPAEPTPPSDAPAADQHDEPTTTETAKGQDPR